MTELTIYSALLIASFALAGIVFIALFFIDAPYGRHTRGGWGPTLNKKVGWIVMEAPAALVFALYFVLGEHRGVASIVFLALWEAHYIHRAFIFPFTLRGQARSMPLATVAMAVAFNVLNTYLNGRYIFTLSGGYPASWLADPRFLAGAALFVGGYAINRWADTALRGLRSPGEEGYQVPCGGLFEYISSPNYFGEIVEWIGWAVLTWSLPGLAFAVWTVANLAPRARANLRWYRREFPDYPAGRKALIPGVW